MKVKGQSTCCSGHILFDLGSDESVISEMTRPKKPKHTWGTLLQSATLDANPALMCIRAVIRFKPFMQIDIQTVSNILYTCI